MPKPIYLYVKTHNKTGLKYLGKTIQNPFKYLGSGKYWKLHLDKHGKDISTEILLVTQDENELHETALFFSKLWNVAKSDLWANLCEEDGYGHSHLYGGKIQSDLMKKRIAEGTSPHYMRTFNKKKSQQKRILNGTHNLVGKVTVIDKFGKGHNISKELYWNQTGPIETWEYVANTSKEGRKRYKS